MKPASIVLRTSLTLIIAVGFSIPILSTALGSGSSSPARAKDIDSAAASNAEIANFSELRAPRNASSHLGFSLGFQVFTPTPTDTPTATPTATPNVEETLAAATSIAAQTATAQAEATNDADGDVTDLPDTGAGQDGGLGNGYAWAWLLLLAAGITLRLGLQLAAGAKDSR